MVELASTCTVKMVVWTAHQNRCSTNGVLIIEVCITHSLVNMVGIAH